MLPNGKVFEKIPHSPSTKFQTAPTYDTPHTSALLPSPSSESPFPSKSQQKNIPRTRGSITPSSHILELASGGFPSSLYFPSICFFMFSEKISPFYSAEYSRERPLPAGRP